MKKILLATSILILLLSVLMLSGCTQTPITCGNGAIDPLETCLNCPEDVGDCPPSQSWDGGWDPINQSYDANGFATDGDGMCFFYSKTSSNPDVYQAEGWNGPTSTLYEWCFMLRNKQGINQTIHQFISEGSGMRTFYSTVLDGHIFKPWYTEDGVTFTKCESSYDSATYTFTYWFTPTSQYCKVACFFPWNYAMNQAWADTFEGQSYARVTDVATSPKIRTVRMVEFSNDFSTEEGKKHVVMIARQHAVESADSACIWGLMEEIAETPSLRENIHWYIIPAMDVDGLALDSVSGRPGFQTWNQDVVQEVVAVRTLFNSIHENYTIDMFFDWHSQGSGLSSHILCRSTEALIIGSLIHTAIPRYDYYTSTYGDATAFGYAYLHWGCFAYTPEVCQANWSHTYNLLKNDGIQIANILENYYFP